MITPIPALLPKVEVRLHDRSALPGQMPRLEAYLLRGGPLLALSRHPAWLTILDRGLRHDPYCLEAVEGDRTRGFLPLAYVRSLLFGRFLVSLPYLNSGGVVADDDAIAQLLIDQAVGLANHLAVRYLEIRHERSVGHPALGHGRTDKVHMRLDLPGTPGKLWDQLAGKVRNQVRKGQKGGLTVAWGGRELLADFYAVFSHNMRDLGTPVYSKQLFAQILEQFPRRAELCIIRAGTLPVAAGLLQHGWGVSEVPSASSLRSHNHTCANMLLYWHLLERSVQRGQDIFDFGRSSQDSPTYRFKKQWGAMPVTAEWQYYLRSGDVTGMRQDSPRYRRWVQLWQRLPVCLTRLLGPRIVRGIP